MNLFDDLFISERLNPLFLQELRKYWVIVSGANEDKEKILSAQKNLLAFLYRRLFQPLYLKHSPKIKGSLFCLTIVRPDGIGDYFATLKSAKTLKQAHPESEVHVVYTHQLPLPPIDPADYLLQSNCMHEFMETADRPTLEPVLKGYERLPFEIQMGELEKERQKILQEYEHILKNHAYAVQSLTDLIADYDRQIQHLQEFTKVKNRAVELYEKMKQSRAIINIALAINTFDNPLLAPKSLYFAEAGNFQGIANYMHFNWFSMGLEPFEEGIFLKKTFSEASSIAVEQRKSSLYLAYLPKISEERLIFIHLVCLMQKQDPRPIDILLPVIEEEELPLNPHWFAQAGISEVVLVRRNGSENSLFKTGIQPAKVLRLVQALPMPPVEFEKMIALSGEVVGCTGDGSLSDCLIAGKIPFYELRRHKLQMWYSFEALAEHFKLGIVLNYLKIQEAYQEQKAESVAEYLFNILKHKEFKAQWGRLINIINQYYCFEEALLSHVNRHVLHSQFPSLSQLEEQLVQGFLEGQISPRQAWATLDEKFSSGFFPLEDVN